MRDTLAKPSLTQSNSRREFLLKSAGLFGVATMASADRQLVALPTLNQRVYGREPALHLLIRNGQVGLRRRRPHRNRRTGLRAWVRSVSERASPLAPTPDGFESSAPTRFTILEFPVALAFTATVRFRDLGSA